MKLGYRDRIILLVVFVILILGVGIFVFIKPKWEELNVNKQTYETVSAEWDTKMLEFDKIPARQDNIQNKYQEADKIVKNFSDELTSVELDEFLQKEFLNVESFKNDGVVVRDGYDVADERTTTMSYYYYTPSIVTYPLYEYADLDGSLQKAAEEKRHDADVLSARTAQAVATATASFTMQINRENVMNLLNAVEKYAKDHSDAMLIREVSLEEYDFNAEVEAEEGGMIEQVVGQDEEGNDIIEMVPDPNAGATEEGVKPGYTKATISYEVYFVQSPTEPDVGPSYNKDIWNGNDWRTAVVE